MDICWDTKDKSSYIKIFLERDLHSSFWLGVILAPQGNYGNVWSQFLYYHWWLLLAPGGLRLEISLAILQCTQDSSPQKWIVQHQMSIVVILRDWIQNTVRCKISIWRWLMKWGRMNSPKECLQIVNRTNRHLSNIYVCQA